MFEIIMLTPLPLDQIDIGALGKRKVPYYCLRSLSKRAVSW